MGLTCLATQSCVENCPKLLQTCRMSCSSERDTHILHSVPRTSSFATTLTPLAITPLPSHTLSPTLTPLTVTPLPSHPLSPTSHPSLHTPSFPPSHLSPSHSSLHKSSLPPSHLSPSHLTSSPSLPPTSGPQGDAGSEAATHSKRALCSGAPSPWQPLEWIVHDLQCRNNQQ